MRGTKPTLRQKKEIAGAGLNWEKWLVYRQTDGQLEIRHRYSGRLRRIPAAGRGR